MLNEIAPRTRPNRDDAGHVPGGRDIQTPFADEVLRLRRTRPFSEPIVSFHALPWGQGRNLASAGPIGEKYRQLFGEAFPDTEVTYSAGVLDSYFQPSASLDLAQHLAAEAFRADCTFFLTCGTPGSAAGAGRRPGRPGHRRGPFRHPRRTRRPNRPEGIEREPPGQPDAYPSGHHPHEDSSQ